jgi:hypothetical protein
MRMATATLNPTAVKTFPEKDLTDAIISWWTEETSTHTDDPFAAPGTLYDVLTDVDSLSAVNVLLVLEPIVRCGLPESLIKPGGYSDKQAMVDHLLPAISAFLTKRSH